MMEAARLTVELVPRNTWGFNLRSLLSTEQWDVLRRRTYRKANYRCEICNGVGSAHPVECHEIWEYNDRRHLQKLVGLIALCPACHKVKHYGRSMTIGEEEPVLFHLCTVNLWSRKEAEKYLEKAFNKWQHRSFYEWTIDTGWLKKECGVEIGLIKPETPQLSYFMGE